ncbi:MAG: hypothetical protein IKZ10_03995 [Akkermansia sp.]|nr:hypothetical protein [Akkermansia sp.]
MYRKLQSLTTSVELPALTPAPTKFIARVFFDDCDRLSDSWLNYHVSCSDIRFFKKAWDKEKLSSLLDGAILTTQQKEQILSHNSYAELTREIDAYPKHKAASAFWDMIEPLAELYEKRVGVQFMSFVYPQFFRTAFFNSLNLVGTHFSLSDDGCLTYTSRGLRDCGVYEVEYVLPKKMHCDFGRAHASWLNACSAEDMITQAMAEDDANIRLILPFRSILDQMLLNQIPLEPGIYQDLDNAEVSYRIEQCVLNTGKSGIRMTAIPNH